MVYFIEQLGSIISENFNRVFSIRNTYKCMAYVQDPKEKDKLVDAFENKDSLCRR